MQELTVCYRVIGATKCGGHVKFWHDNPTSRAKICCKCGFVYFFSPAFDGISDIECDYHDHKIYQQQTPEDYAEQAACRSGR